MDIPPCISNWKNNEGYTIPLDKRSVQKYIFLLFRTEYMLIIHSYPNPRPLPDRFVDSQTNLPHSTSSARLTVQLKYWALCTEAGVHDIFYARSDEAILHCRSFDSKAVTFHKV